MKRRFFNILSALSLLLCLATMVLGILSIWVVTTGSNFGEGGPSFVVWSNGGCIEVEYDTGLSPVTRPFTGFRASPAHSIHDSRWNHLGFFVLKNPPPSMSFFIIPDWFICSVTAVLPCLWYRSYRRNRDRKLKGLCLTCGYDLRTIKDRCPECGTPIVATEAKA